MLRIYLLCRNLLLAIVVIVAGMVFIAGPASAHHPDIDGVAVCNPATGKYDVTWTIESDQDYNKDWKLTSVSRALAGIALNDLKDDQTDFVGTESVSPGAGTLSLTVTARWQDKANPNNGVVTETRTGSVKIPNDPCDDTSKKINYCHWDNGNQYSNHSNASIPGLINGHMGHPNDIWPAFTYQGVNYPAQGDQSILGNGCKAAVPNDAAADVSVGAPTCTSTSSVTFTKTNATSNPTNPNLTPGTHSVTFTATAGHLFPGGSPTKTMSYTVLDKLDTDDPLCANKNADASVDVTQPNCQQGSVTTFDMTNATSNPTQPNQAPGTHSVTFTADAGYRFVQNGNRVKTITVSYTVLDKLDADDPLCASKDADADVTVTKADCLNTSVVTFSMTNATANPVNPDQSVGTHSVTFTADSGYRFVENGNRVKTKTVSYTVDGKISPDDDQCAGKDADAVLSTTPPACGVGEKLVLGATLHATWGVPSLTEGPGNYLVTATADPNHRFSDGNRTRDYRGTLAGPLPDNNGPNFPGCDRDDQPDPTKRQVTDQRSACDLRDVGGTEWWTDEWTTTYVWSDVTGWTPQETGPVRIAEWFVPFTDGEYFAECAPDQPEDLVREVAGVEASCELQGTRTWTDVYTTVSVWNPVTRAWELGEETGPVRTDEQYVPYSDEEFEEECAEEPEVAGEEAEVMDHEVQSPEAEGEDAEVPTAVDAGTSEQSPLQLVGGSSLWLLAIVGGFSLMGIAGWRRHRTANR